MSSDTIINVTPNGKVETVVLGGAYYYLENCECDNSQVVSCEEQISSGSNKTNVKFTINSVTADNVTCSVYMTD